MAIIIILLLFLILCNTTATAVQATNETAEQHPFLYWTLLIIVMFLVLETLSKWGWI